MTAARRYRRTVPEKYKRFGRKVGRLALSAAAARYGGPGGYSRLANDVSWVAGKLNSELKFYDISGSMAPNNVTGTSVLSNAMGQGASSQQRVGNNIRMKHFMIRGRVNINASAASTITKIVVVVDRQANGTAPAYSSSAGGAGVYENASVESWRDLGNARRYKVLATRIIKVDSTESPEKYFQISVRFPRWLGKTYYFPGLSGGAIGDLATNSLYVLAFSDEATNTPTVTYHQRLRFVDN